MDENDINGLLARSQLSMSLLQNRPDLIGGIDLNPPSVGRGHSENIINNYDHILEFIDLLIEHDIVVTPDSSRRTSDQIIIFFWL